MKPRPFLVAITGGSGSGKTTLAEAVADRLGRDRVSILSQDAYYRDRSDLPPHARAILNYDVPEAFDHLLFAKHLRTLSLGFPIHAPVYSYEFHTRVARTRLVRPGEIVLVDGLLLLVSPEIQSLFDIAIFVDAPAPVRLQRRMRRDLAERGRTRAAILTQFYGTVEPSHQKYVEPTKTLADLVLPSTGHLDGCVQAAVGAVLDRLHRRNGGREAIWQAVTLTNADPKYI